MYLNSYFSKLFILTFFTLSLSAQEHYERLSQLDVLSYQFELTLNDANNIIEGQATIEIEFLKKLEEFQLDLVSQRTDGMGMKVTEVLKNGQETSFSQEGDQLEIKTSIQEDETHLFTIKYSGIPRDGLIIGQNRHGSRTFFGDNWPNRAHHWLPTVDHPSDKATVDWIITAPDHYQVVANGIQVEETNLDNDRKLTHWKTDVVIPTKVMVIGAAPFAVQYVDQIQGVPVTSWIFKEDRDIGFYDYSPAVGVLHWFIDHVAPYPYAKLANVQSKTRYGGMENAGNIFYSEGSVNGNRTIENLLAHEIAHQWFGNTVSEADWHHVWLSEGFATYFTNLYVEGKHGRDEMEALLQSQRTRIIRFTKTNNTPIVNTKIKNYNQLLNTNSYQKGGWVLHMLRNEIGEENFWKGIKQYYNKYKYKNAFTEDFQREMEKVSGKKLDWFFEQWIYRPGIPTLAVDWKYRKENKTVTFDINQLNVKDPYQLTLEVELLDVNNQRLGTHTLKLSDKEQVLKIENVTAGVTKIRLDPNTNLLFEGKLSK